MFALRKVTPFRVNLCKANIHGNALVFGLNADPELGQAPQTRGPQG